MKYQFTHLFLGVQNRFITYTLHKRAPSVFFINLWALKYLPIIQGGPKNLSHY